MEVDGWSLSKAAGVWLHPLQDPRGTRLRQWLHQDAVLGVVSKHFRLSNHPPLGQWRIDVAAASVSMLRLKKWKF